MMDGKLSCEVYAGNVPYIAEAKDYADEFLLTAAAQRNRNFVSPFVKFENVSFAMEEILFDPQTSGGLLVAVSKNDAENLLEELKKENLPAEIVGEITEKKDIEIKVLG
jgi:selenide,water dikinase